MFMYKTLYNIYISFKIFKKFSRIFIKFFILNKFLVA